MQDTLNGRNLQCFFVPSGIHETTLTIEYKRTKRKFNFEKTLPYQSLAYDYSEDFIIFDYENVRKNWDQAWVHIIEGGKCQFYVPTEAMDEKYPILLVINKYGIPLNIKEPADFLALQEDYLQLLKTIIEIRKDGQPNPLKRIEAQEALFKLKWYDYKKAIQVTSNIVGIALSILAVNKDYDIKNKLARYCNKNNLNLANEIAEYVAWAKLHNIDTNIEELTEILM